VAAQPRTAPTTVAAPDPTTTTLDLSALPSCWPDASLTQPTVPALPDLAAALDGFLADRSVAGRDVSVSVWVDGLGEVLAHDPDRALAPASNQKLLTAMGALTVLGPTARLTTEVRVQPTGELVIEPGGDATLASIGPHSLDSLAVQVRASGVTQASGLLVDETRHDGLRAASGWQPSLIPGSTGPLSAFMVDHNRWRSDAAFLADPATANADRLRDALVAQGVAVTGPTGYASAPSTGRVVAHIESATVAQLIGWMLQFSDNQVADELLQEVGLAARGQGSFAGGAAATQDAIAFLCVPMPGHTDDGSGLSHADARSARELRTLLQAARTASWWPLLDAGLPVAGRTGTLAERMRGTAAEGNVHAKTGTITGGASLTGVGRTAAGRAFVFSVIVNGAGAQNSGPAIDTFVAAIAASSA